MTDDRRTPGNEEVIEVIQESMTSHLDEYHAFNAAQLKVMVGEHRELYDEIRPLVENTNRNVNLLVTEIYGMLKPTAADPQHREGGMCELLKQMNDTLEAFKAQAQNGGISTTRRWTSGQWAFYGALATGWFLLVGTVIAAVWPN